MTEMDVLGPVDYLVVEFPADKANFSGEVAAELKDLIARGLVRVLDLILLRKDPDGSIEAVELEEVEDSLAGELREIECEAAMLLAEEDIESIGMALAPGAVAGVLVWENTWAGPFGAAVRRAGGQLVASGSIPTQAILAAVEAERDAGEPVKEGV
jgi:Family of unknown function (DUF6325)